MNDILTVPEVAKILKSCNETVRRRIRGGEIPAVKEPGSRNGRFLVYRSALERYLKSFEV